MFLEFLLASGTWIPGEPSTWILGEPSTGILGNEVPGYWGNQVGIFPLGWDSESQYRAGVIQHAHACAYSSGECCAGGG